MSPAVTVLIPTHDHGATLRRALASVRRQSVQDFEVIVVGDGVPDVTREFMAEETAADSRVRFLDFHKGERNGELHRHRALADARGGIVCYLGDDDLWLPEHLEVMAECLADADFAHTLSATIAPDGSVTVAIVDLARPLDRERILTRDSGISLTVAGHAMAAYRRLPHGWRTTPRGIPTDVHMWRQFLADPACRARSDHRPTALHFASSLRAGMTAAERDAELAQWEAKAADERWRRQHAERLLVAAAEQATWFREHDATVMGWAHALEAELREQWRLREAAESASGAP